jgi:hypothetical protein
MTVSSATPLALDMSNWMRMSTALSLGCVLLNPNTSGKVDMVDNMTHSDDHVRSIMVLAETLNQPDEDDVVAILVYLLDRAVAERMQ